MILRIFLLLTVMACFHQSSFSQKKLDTTSSKPLVQKKVSNSKDSLAAAKAKIPDTGLVKFNGPRRAALRSAIIPGWGQATNRKYWKIPIVYGALGATAYAFSFNNTQYKRVAYAYRVLLNAQTTGDTSLYSTVDADLKPFIKAGASTDLRNYRNTYRKDIDYSVLIFLFFWGLNVVDATVDAHLKDFDVSNTLSMKIKPGFNTGTNNLGLGLVFDIHKAKPKLYNIYQ